MACVGEDKSTRGVNKMKIKKMLSALLAMVMVLTLTCTPAFAAGRADTLADINDDDAIWVGVTNVDDLKTEVTIKARYWDASGGAISKGEASDPRTWTVYEVPLGVTIAAGPNNKYLRNIWVYSDPDGDGVYEERIQKISYDKDGNYVSDEMLPAAAAGPITVTSDVDYYNVFNWGYGSNIVCANLKNIPGYHTVTTDYLVELFGANTLILFFDNDEEYYHGIYLTGKEAPEGIVYPLEKQGVYFSDYGTVVSSWAVKSVDAAGDVGLIYELTKANHNYDFTGKITRAEFARIAVDLYYILTDATEGVTLPENPFDDVNEDTDFYTGILAAYKLGIVTGKTTTTFAPNALVTRQEAAAMLARAYTKAGGEIPSVTATTFADNGDIASYARDAVAFMSSHEIINGVGGNLFNPKGNTTVEQALKIAVEMLDKLNK